MIDLGALGLTEILRLQEQLQHELTHRFERHMALVFSDIVGSTPYFARFGDARGHQLKTLHLDLLDNCLPAREGRIVDVAGDGAFVAFPNAGAATDAVVEFQELICRENSARERDHQLRVRIGVHWGPVLTDGKVTTGDAANLCARVTASADVGEIRLTRDAFQTLAPLRQVHCRPLGAVVLKGIGRQVELYSLDWRDHALFPTCFRLEETRVEAPLPLQDIIAFGRLAEHEGAPANDVVLALPEQLQARQISRWHFELRRYLDGLRLHQVSDGVTEVNGKTIGKGQEAIIRPGSKVRVANVLTITFSSPPADIVPENLETTMVGRFELP
jgi:class 3 adenylate cyclase